MLSIDFDALDHGRHVFVLEVSDTPGKAAINIPIHVLVGRKSRPRFAVVGGVHGDEYDGIRAAQRLSAEQVPEVLDGTLVVIPVANPSSFTAGQRRTAIDDTDLNRVFPGAAEGGFSQRLAFALTQSVLRHMDLVFTLHGASTTGRLAPYLEFFAADTEVGRRSCAAAVAAGFANLVAVPRDETDSPLKGCLLPALGELGVPVIEGEVGGRGELLAANVDFYLERVADVMAHLGLVPKRVRAIQQRTHRVLELRDVTATSNGILQRHVELHEHVSKGQRLAAIVDGEGRELELTAPCEGVVGGYRGHSWIQSGQMAIRLFVPAIKRN